MEPIQCRRCNTEMELGHIPDFGGSRYGGHYLGHYKDQVWAEGEPKNSFWWGLKTDKIKFQVEAYRCPQCGCMEFFANKKVY